MNKPLLLTSLFAAFWLAAPASQASIRIVPESRSAAQLRATETNLQVEVNPSTRLAKVTATWVYANVSKQNFEADLIAEAPSSAIMTQFAYWFREQKTLARIVEKERAARIYAEANAPQRRRDPALVEMIKRNFFHIRIAPVEAEKPLKVELVWLQPIEKSGNQFKIELPWRQETPALVLEKFSLNAHFSSPVTELSSSLEGAKKGTELLEFTDPDGGVLPANVSLSFQRATPAALAQSKGSSDGFFTAIVNEATWTQRAKWTGVNSLYSRLVSKSERLVVGRFTKEAPAKQLGLASQADKEQSQLWWAACALDDMARSDANRDKGMAISKRFGIPSKWTNWLAIPDSERERLFAAINREKVNAALNDYNRLGPALAQWKANGHENTPQFRAMLADFKRVSSLAAKDPNFRIKSLQDFYNNAAWILLEAARNNAEYTVNPSIETVKKLRTQIGRLIGTKGDLNGLRSDMEVYARLIRGRQTARNALNAVLKGQSSKKWLTPLRASITESSYDSIEVQNIADAYVRNRKSKPALAKQLKSLLVAINFGTGKSRAESKDVREYIGAAESRIYGQQLQTLSYGLQREIIGKRENGLKYAELRQKYEALQAKLEYPAQVTAIDLSGAIGVEQKAILRLQNDANANAAEIAKHQAELDRLKQFIAPGTYESTVKYATDRWMNYEGQDFLARRWSEVAMKEGGDSPNAAKVKANLERIIEAEKKRGYFYRPALDAQLKTAELRVLEGNSKEVFTQYTDERRSPTPNPQKLASLRAKLDALQAATVYNKDANDIRIERSSSYIVESILELVREENEKPQLDKEKIAGWNERLIEVGSQIKAYPHYYYDSYDYIWPYHPLSHYLDTTFKVGSDAEREKNIKDYLQMAVERIGIQGQLGKAKARLDTNTPLSATDKQNLETQVAQLRQLDNQLRVRMGDPLIAVKTPATATKVLAIFPSGELMTLRFNAIAGHWEARFDVPTYANEGDYAVQIVVVYQNGERQHLTMHFAVDMQAPNGLASWKIDGQNVLLQLQTDEHTNRVSAFLPWNERVELQRGANDRFEANAPLPIDFGTQPSVVRFVLTDKAHNRTEITVDSTP